MNPVDHRRGSGEGRGSLVLIVNGISNLFCITFFFNLTFQLTFFVNLTPFPSHTQFPLLLPLPTTTTRGVHRLLRGWAGTCILMRVYFRQHYLHVRESLWPNEGYRTRQCLFHYGLTAASV